MPPSKSIMLPEAKLKVSPVIARARLATSSALPIRLAGTVLVQEEKPSGHLLSKLLSPIRPNLIPLIRIGASEIASDRVTDSKSDFEAPYIS